MKRLIIPSVVVLVVAAVTLSVGVFSGVGESALTGDSAKECSRTSVTASFGKECNNISAVVAARSLECGDNSQTVLSSSGAKQCGESVTATKAANMIECPHSGTVLKTADAKESCGEKDVCCENHAFASVE